MSSMIPQSHMLPVCCWTSSFDALKIISGGLALVFIWSLLPLQWIGFVHRCSRLPGCGSSGVAVSDLIADAHSTAVFATLFFYPFVFAWSNVKQLGNKRDLGIKESLLAYQGMFGAFLICPPTFVIWRAGLTGCFSLGMCIHSYLLLFHCAQPRRFSCTILFITASLGFAAYLLAIGMLVVGDRALISQYPYLQYVSESCVLTASVLFTLLWRHSDRERIVADATESLVEKQTPHIPIEKSTPMCIVGMLLPILFVWCAVPFTWIGFTHRCAGWPKCELIGVTLSMMICTPQATGAMAALFFYPCLCAWENVQQLPQNSLSSYGPTIRSILVVIHIGFGMFLICQVRQREQWATLVGNGHIFFVGVFGFATVLYCHIMRAFCAQSRRWLCNLLFWSGLVSFAGMPFVFLLSRVNDHLLIANAPFLYYIFECCGLSALAAFPIVWRPDVTLQSEGD